MNSLALAGGRIIDPASGRDEFADILIADGRIAAIGGPGKASKAERTIDCTGRLVVPGFIDLHVHLREPPILDAARRAEDGARRVGRPAAQTFSEKARRVSRPAAGSAADEPPETIASGAAAAAAGGFTTICAMPNTQPPIDSAEAVAYYLEGGRAAGFARVLPVGCQTAARAGRRPADLAAMRAAGAVAFSDDGSDVADAAVFERVARLAARLGAPLLCHCEDAVIAAGGKRKGSRTLNAFRCPGPFSFPPESEESAVRRACETAALTGCHIHICHVSTGGAAEAVRRAKAAGAPVTAEAAPHHLALAEESLAGRNAVFKVNPPLRSGHDVDAVLAAVRDGTIDCLATDHAPHTAAAKSRPLAEAPPGMIGLESALAVYAKALVEAGLLTWPQLVAKLTAGPARVLGIDAGTLAVGAQADVTVIDPEMPWTIDPARFRSRARNCPFAGWEVRGRPVITIVGGNVLYECPGR